MRPLCVQGFVVTEIMEGSQAHHQGLKAGDVLCSAQQISLKDLPEEDVPAFLLSVGPGATVHLAVDILLLCCPPSPLPCVVKEVWPHRFSLNGPCFCACQLGSALQQSQHWVQLQFRREVSSL